MSAGPATPLICPRSGGASAWLEAERPNLGAAVGYAAGSGRHRHATQIPAAMGDFLAARGHWDQAATLHQTALTAARQAGDQPGQASSLHDLGRMGTFTGDYTAAASLAQAVALYGCIGDRVGQAYALCQQGTVQRWTGNYSAAIASYEQALVLARGSDDQRAQACALQLLSVRAVRGRRLPGPRGESGQRAGPVPQPASPARPGRNTQIPRHTAHAGPATTRPPAPRSVRPWGSFATWAIGPTRPGPSTTSAWCSS